MKKTLAFLVLAVFLVSALPLVIAEGQNGQGQSGTQSQTETQSQTDTENQTGTSENDDNDNGNDSLITGAVIMEQDRDREMDCDGDCNGTGDEPVRDRDRDGNYEGEDKGSANSEGGMRAAVAGFQRIKTRIVEKFMGKHPEIVEKFLLQLNNTNKTNVLEHLDRARLEKCLNNTDECNEKIKEWKVKEIKVKDFLRKRVIEKDKIHEANNAFLKAQNKYLNAQNNQLKVRDDFLGLKLRLAECRNTSNNCSALEQETFEKAQEDLNQIADKLISYLEKVKSKVEGAENLNETDAKDAIENIDDLIERLEDAKEAVNAADTKEELQAAGKLIQDVWKDMDFKALFYSEKIINAQVGQIFSRSELLEKRLDVVIERLENKSINVTGLQDLLDDFSEKIDDARTKMEEANDLFAQAKELRANNETVEAKEKLEEAKELTTQAHADLKEAHKILMDLVHQINQKGESFDPDEIDEEEDIEVVEEDD